MDWKIWGKKWLTGMGTVVVGTIITFSLDYVQATNFPAEYAFIGGVLIIVLNQISNWWKHRNPETPV